MHIPVARWVTPEEFDAWKRVGEVELGFKHVEAGPLVRSSYHAKEQAREVEAGGPLFRIPGETVLGQSTYTLEHPEIGRLDLFLVPVARDEQGVQYEAVIN